MKKSTLVWLNVSFYTVWALAGAWSTAMAGVKWNSMGWEEQSCLIAGIVLTWSATMKALFDNSLVDGGGNHVDNTTNEKTSP